MTKEQSEPTDDGEAAVQASDDEVTGHSFSWGGIDMDVVDEPGATDAAKGKGKGKATPGDFVFVHVYDKSSPIL